MKVHLSYDSHWTESDGTMVCGSAFLNGTHLSTRELAEKISDVTDTGELRTLLSALNGFFSVIHEINDEVYVAVDHVRSWPIYYALTDDLYISDSAEWVHDVGARNGYDSHAMNEYLFTCYITGRETLSSDVKQTQSGELLVFNTNGTRTDLTRERYYTYDSSDDTGGVDDLDDRMLEAFHRLIQYADGRTILLGLSAGYDSRLIALMLRRLGYDNTITYTTRTVSRDSSEIETAESIAHDLGFEHIRITTGPQDYENLDDSDRDMIDDIGYLSEYPHINKSTLKEQLANENIDIDDVVHVLGHHLIGAGSFLSDEIRDRDTITRDEFFDTMWNPHYSNWVEQGDYGLRETFKERMFDKLPIDLYRDGNVETISDAMKGFDQWYWQERLPKYVLARREYEYLGFDMWYPFLDRTLCSFYARCDYEAKVDKRILKNYVRDLEAEIRGVTHIEEPNQRDRSLTDIVWNTGTDLIHELPSPITERVRQIYYDRLHTPERHGDDPRYNIITEAEFDSIEFPVINTRTLLLLYLYDRGYFDLPETNEFDIALGK